jgi:hypothetical protein
MAGQMILRNMSVHTAFKKLTVSQIVKISVGTLPCSQKPTNGPYSELHESLHTFQHFFFKSVLILSARILINIARYHFRCSDKMF